MECPKCLKNWVCGCKSCKSRRTTPIELKVGIFTEDGEGMQCPYCSTIFHPDQLLDYEWGMMKGVVTDNQLIKIRKEVMKSKVLKNILKDE